MPVPERHIILGNQLTTTTGRTESECRPCPRWVASGARERIFWRVLRQRFVKF